MLNPAEQKWVRMQAAWSPQWGGVLAIFGFLAVQIAIVLLPTYQGNLVTPGRFVLATVGLLMFTAGWLQWQAAHFSRGLLTLESEIQKLLAEREEPAAALQSFVPTTATDGPAITERPG